MRITPIAFVCLLLGAVGCQPAKVNPSFDVSKRDAKRALRAMADDPRPAARPIVIIGGYHDPGVGPAAVAGKLRPYFTDVTVIRVTPGYAADFDAARALTLRRIAEATHAPADQDTVEVDVVGTSMGGIVARYAALPLDGRPRVRIVNLFTIASPHRGAELADLPAMTTLHRDMRKDSAFITMLRDREDEIDYTLVPYTFLGDEIVGQENTSLSDAPPYWLDKPDAAVAHLAAALDPRILADIVRRLRDDPPLTAPTPAPLPH